MLIRALPLTKEVRDFLVEHDTIYFVEQNRDAQMAAIIKDENPELGAKIVSILRLQWLTYNAEGDRGPDL